MKKSFTKAFIFFMILFCCSVWANSAISQTTQVMYSYDATGNRTGRTILFSSSFSEREVVAEETKEGIIPLEDILGDQLVLIYPNPTKGHLKVEFKDYFPSKSEINVSLFRNNGELIIRKDLDGPIIDLDLTMQPNGMYLLVISDGKANNTWKIIKQ
jgi:hypothetical protein